MTHAELIAITAQGPAVIMVARDDMLALLARVERAEAGLAAAVAAERAECAAIMYAKQRFYEALYEKVATVQCMTSAGIYENAGHMIRARGTT